jgi:hypothetical protein
MYKWVALSFWIFKDIAAVVNMGKGRSRVRNKMLTEIASAVLEYLSVGSLNQLSGEIFWCCKPSWAPNSLIYASLAIEMKGER